ncbi:MAG: DUF2791 family P-loop domain-containing protein [Acidobacteria bacterium]|nr:DUF2791 family P-loop domain-containing protein [Acidobacteriota bacterium]
MTDSEDVALTRRRALEALRNGVPNPAAVEILGCRQPAAEAAFTERLARAAEGDGRSGGVPGVLFSGNFGSGKSHLLTHLERLALSRGFVCSRVAVSKETPLYDLGKVFKSAVENARMPGRQGRMIEELASAMDWKSEPSAGFFQWTDGEARAGRLSLLFPATLLVYERLGNPETNRRIESFWAGDRIRAADVNEGLRQIGQKKNYSFRAPRAADLPPQRLRFATALIRAAGYRGWVILLDEIELVGYYSLLQRGRSYAELARWLAPAAGDVCPGLVAAGTVIDAFYLDVVSPDGKQDCDYVRPRMEASRHADLALRAEAGMRLLHDQRCIPLEDPTDQDVRGTVEKLRRIYSEAYGWDAPAVTVTGSRAGTQDRMRYWVRAAIIEWDLMRIYPGVRPETVDGGFRHTFKENTDLERASQDDPPDAG